MRFFLVLLVIFVNTGLLAQGEGGVFTSQRLASIKTGEGSLGNNPSALNWFNDLRNKTAKLGGERQLTLEDIQGSVYLTEDFKMGDIYYRYTKYGKYELRYDAFNDEIELKRKRLGPIEALHKNEAISCVIEGNKYRFLKFKTAKEKLEEGYLIPIYEGSTYTLYIRRLKIFKEGKQAKTSLQNSFPPRFVDEESYYLAYEDQIPVRFKTSKKEVFNFVANDRRSELKTFFKENSINLKERSDLIGTFAFLDTE